MPAIEPPPAKAQALLRIIVKAAEKGRFMPDRPETFLSYSEALDLLGEREPSFRSGPRLRRAGLEALNEWTRVNPELPKIAALIVNKRSHRPSLPFAESHGKRTDGTEWEKWWMAEANRAIRYEWTPFLSSITPCLKVEEPFELVVGKADESDPPDFRKFITIEPGKRGGKPCIRGMRITVSDVLGWLACGMSYDEIRSDFPEVTVEDIRACLAFAAEKEQHAVSLK